MPSTTTNYSLALYNSTTDGAETFLDYRTAMAGTAATSNMQRIDTALDDIQSQVTVLDARKGIIPISAVYTSPNYYEATSLDITSYDTDQIIAMTLDTDSNGTVTLNINSLGTLSVMKVNAAGSYVNINGADLRAGREYNFKYDGTRWVWMDAQSSDQINTEGTSGNLVSISSTNDLEDSTYAPSDFAPAAQGVTNGNSHDHVGGDGGLIPDGGLSLTDVTTNNASASAHGFLPKLSGEASNTLRGDGTWGDVLGIGYKNLIINGSMIVSQRGTTEAGITSGGYKKAPDRWTLGLSSAGTWTVSQGTSVPTGEGFSNSYYLACTTADASLSASDYVLIRTKLEGRNLQHIKKGTASAESLTLSFRVRSTLTGTHIVELEDTTNNRSISATYTINVSNTWEYKTVTFAGDTTDTIANDNTAGLSVNFWLAAGSNWSGGTLATTWGTMVPANRAVGQVNLANSTSNVYALTGVQLEIGDTDTYFEHLPYEEVLEKCMWYYQLIGSGSNDIIGTGYYSTSTNIIVTIPLTTPMRTTPSFDIVTGTGYYATQLGDVFNSLTLNTPSTNRLISAYNSSEVSGTLGVAFMVKTNNASAYFGLDAEL